MNLVLQGGGNVDAEMLTKIVAAMWTSGVFVFDEILLRTALAHDVRVLVAHWTCIADVNDGRAFQLAREQHNAAVAGSVEQWKRANRALQVFKPVFVFAKRSRDIIKPGRHTVIARLRVPNLVVDDDVPPLHRPLHCNNAPGDDVEKRKAHGHLSVAVRVHETDGERGDVGCTVLIGRQQLNESREAGLDATCCSGCALHVHVFADEHDSGADLKVVVDGVDKPAEQVPGVAGGAKVAAGVGLEFGFNGSHQLLQKAVHVACDGVCGFCIVRAEGVTRAHYFTQELLQLVRQAVKDSS